VSTLEPETFDLCPLDELRARKCMGFRFHHPVRGEHEIDLVWDGERAYAIEDLCPHGLTSLLNGDILPGEIVCPAHGAVFDLASGRCTDGYTSDTQAYRVEVRDGRVLVSAPGERRIGGPPADCGKATIPIVTQESPA
jgi:nitrite reductase/ring-hydroxylating ferredoxin subunit